MSKFKEFKEFKNKTCVVTGAAGFIGSHLCQTLLQHRANVIGIDNFLTGHEDNVGAIINAVGDLEENFLLIEADVNQPPETYLKTDLPIDYFFHFASPASPDKYQQYPRQTYLVNSWATHQILDFLHVYHKQARFLFASTSEVYGDPLQHPQKESYWGNVNPNGPRSCYDESKRMGEAICGVHERDFEMDIRIVRIFNTYGPRMDINDGRVVPNFIKFALADEKLQIYGDGKQTRSYCYISDLIDGVLRMTVAADCQGETINLGNCDEYNVLQTAELIKKTVTGQFNREQDLVFKPLPQDDPSRRRPDLSKAKQLLNWQPTINFKQGLKPTVDYFQQKMSQG